MHRMAHMDARILADCLSFNANQTAKTVCSGSTPVPSQALSTDVTRYVALVVSMLQ
jgi:hypothetical protein